MSEFKLKLELEYIDGRVWRVTAPFDYLSDLAGPVKVVAGFLTDFNSTPEFLWSLLPPCDYAEAGVVHDMLYRAGVVTRLVADQTHREVLRLLHAPGWKIALYYAGVRAGGWRAWAKYRNAEQEPVHVDGK